MARTDFSLEQIEPYSILKQLDEKEIEKEEKYLAKRIKTLDDYHILMVDKKNDVYKHKLVFDAKKVSQLLINIRETLGAIKDTSETLSTQSIGRTLKVYNMSFDDSTKSKMDNVPRNNEPMIIIKYVYPTIYNAITRDLYNDDASEVDFIINNIEFKEKEINMFDEKELTLTNIRLYLELFDNYKCKHELDYLIAFFTIFNFGVGELVSNSTKEEIKRANGNTTVFNAIADLRRTNYSERHIKLSWLKRELIDYEKNTKYRNYKKHLDNEKKANSKIKII